MQCAYTEYQELATKWAKPSVGSAQLDVARVSRANHYVNLIGFGKDGYFNLFSFTEVAYTRIGTKRRFPIRSLYLDLLAIDLPVLDKPRKAHGKACVCVKPVCSDEGAWVQGF